MCGNSRAEIPGREPRPARRDENGRRREADRESRNNREFLRSLPKRRESDRKITIRPGEHGTDLSVSKIESSEVISPCRLTTMESLCNKELLGGRKPPTPREPGQ